MYRRNLLFGYGKKAIMFLLCIVLLSLIVFYAARLAPSDPLVTYYGDYAQTMTSAERERAAERLGLSDPLHIQYLRWLSHGLQGNFGISYQYKTDVLTLIGQRLTGSLVLGGAGFVLTFTLALLLGVLCACFADRWLDRILCKVGTLTSCIPEFWLALILIWFFAVKLGVLPSSGAYSVGMADNVLDRLTHMILPLTVIVLSHLWYYAYMVRSKMLEEIRADYVLLAKAKGLSRYRVLFGHCLRNVIPTYLSLMATAVPHILSGTYIVETVFSYPGLGTLAYASARYQDYNLLMVLCILSGALVILCSFAAQSIGAWIDPRLRAKYAVERWEVQGHG